MLWQNTLFNEQRQHISEHVVPVSRCILLLCDMCTTIMNLTQTETRVQCYK